VQLRRVSAAGGQASVVTPLGPEVNYVAPSFLPDGKRFLFTVTGPPDSAGVYLGSLDATRPTRLVPDITPGLYLPAASASDDGFLVSLQGDNVLTARRLDLATQAVKGEPAIVASDVGYASISSSGLIAYRAGAGSGQRQLAWFDSRGAQIETVGAPDSISAFDLSPDGKNVAITVESSDSSEGDLWILEIARGLKTRFTFAKGLDRQPIWSPDGRWLAFVSSRSGRSELYRKAVDGAVGSEELVYTDDRAKQPTSWSPDGKYLLFSAIDPKTKSDLWLLPMTGERKPIAFAQTEFAEVQGVFSPDGHWIAYVSDESGTADVYVAPFPGPGGKRLISTRQAGLGQGGVPTWRPDGKEIFYIAPDRSLMAVSLTIKGTALEPGLPRMLFGPILAVGGRNYAVSRDGKRFLAVLRPGVRADVPITLVQNWKPPR
jgi:dipeptidyl aminopeptidase/acylaminoacyl peptidase